MTKIVAWVSCGTASAVNAKMVLARYGSTHDCRLVRILVPEEHPDNDRFARDLESWLRRPIENIRSLEYSSCADVWQRRRFMSGPHGAVCSREMKKVVRWELEREWQPDLQSFGYTADEQRRIDRFTADNPDVRLVSMLAEAGLSKEDCHAIIDRAGLQLPAMYRLGFPNANCRGCVNAQSPDYWNRTRHHFPEIFAERAALSRELGVRLVKTTTGDRPRLFLDELNPSDMSDDGSPAMDCSLLCYAAEQSLEDDTPVKSNIPAT